MRSEILVDIPNDDGVHVKSAGAKGEKYVYKYVKYYRNSEASPEIKQRQSENMIQTPVKCFQITIIMKCIT